MKTENQSFNYSVVYHKDTGNNAGNPQFLSVVKTVGRIKHVAHPLQLFGCCLIDASGRQFACIHEHCQEIGNCFASEITEQNFDFEALSFHPDDKELLCEKMFPDILKFMYQIPVAEYSNYRFSFNHRYIRKDGSVSQFLHTGTLTFSDDKCLPVLNTKVFTEIGDIKPDATINLTISHYSPGLGYHKVFSEVYRETQDSQLSGREKEIIKLCLDGLSSKMIADRLSLSIHTVKNHKRNCMEKTLTHNIAELIHYCIRSRCL